MVIIEKKGGCIMYLFGLVTGIMLCLTLFLYLLFTNHLFKVDVCPIYFGQQNAVKQILEIKK